MLRTTDEAFKNMKAEQLDLKIKIDKLDNFICRCRKNEVRDVTLDEIHLMEEQRGHMMKYHELLSVRVARIEGGY